MITFYAGDRLYPIGDRRNSKPPREQEHPTPVVPLTPEQWAEIDRQRVALQERLRQLGRKFDGNNL